MEQRTSRAWTDERIDDLARRMDAGFERVDRDIRDLRVDMTTQIDGLRQLMIRLNLGLLLAVVGVLAAIVARGG